MEQDDYNKQRNNTANFKNKGQLAIGAPGNDDMYDEEQKSSLIQ